MPRLYESWHKQKAFGLIRVFYQFDYPFLWPLFLPDQAYLADYLIQNQKPVKFLNFKITYNNEKIINRFVIFIFAFSWFAGTRH
jgi:hypothetical protein